MKQIILTISLLAIALALVIGVVVPLLEHGSQTGNEAITRGQSAITTIERVLE